MSDRLCDICGQAPATVFWPDDDPPDEQVGACQPCSDWLDANTHTITDPLVILLGHHLPVQLPDGRVLCLCASAEHPGEGVFDGPVYHREHVAEQIRRVGT